TTCAPVRSRARPSGTGSRSARCSSVGASRSARPTVRPDGTGDMRIPSGLYSAEAGQDGWSAGTEGLRLAEGAAAGMIEIRPPHTREIDEIAKLWVRSFSPQPEEIAGDTFVRVGQYRSSAVAPHVFRHAHRLYIDH